MGKIENLAKYVENHTEAMTDYNYIARMLRAFSAHELVEVFLHFKKRIRSLASQRLYVVLENPFLKEREEVF